MNQGPEKATTRAVSSDHKVDPENHRKDCAIPDHELLTYVGQGSYGQVWLARSITGSYRAVKIIRRDRFEESRPYEREFEGIKCFEPISRQHPGFIGVLHVGRNEASGYFYYVMELADDVESGSQINPSRYIARTLSRDLDRQQYLPPTACLETAVPLASALAHLHERGLVHRDIKPSNIVFVRGEPKFADVGLVTEAGERASFVGTEGYLPPEGPGDPSADVYSLGKVLYQMLTGRPVQDFPEGPRRLIAGDERVAFSQLNEIIVKACDRDRRSRHATARELHSDLLQLSDARQSTCELTRKNRPARNRPEATRQERERKQVTVVSTQVSFSDDLDLEVTQDCFSECVALIRAEILRYAGTIVQIPSGGVVAVFGAPVAHEDHPQRATLAALAIHRGLELQRDKLGAERSIQMSFHSGLSSGLALIGSDSDGLVSGDVVCLASQLSAIAPASKIVVHDALRSHLEGFFSLASIGERLIPGKSKPVLVWEVTQSREVRTRFEVGIQRGLSPFVGREKELTLLKERFAEACNGRGQIVQLAGEAGVGKSRLLLELRRALEGREATWLHGRALSFGSQMPYLPIIDVLRQYFQIDEQADPGNALDAFARFIQEARPDLRAQTDALRLLLSLSPEDPSVLDWEAQDRKLKTFEALRLLLLGESERKPVVLVVEDLHWIDRTSEEFLTEVAGMLAMCKILLVVNYRPGYRNTFPDSTFLTRIMLNPLSDEESARLASAALQCSELLPDVRRLIAAKAEGNPFFVEELVKSLLESGTLKAQEGSYVLAKSLATAEIPDTIQDVLMSRMDRLEPAPRKVLQLASVIGREFDVSLLQTIIELNEPLRSSLQKLQSLELIYERRGASEPTFLFKHALTQDVAYQSLLIQRRQELHRFVAASIEEIHASRLPEYYSLLAYHYQKGEEWERALDYLGRAAERSRRAAAFREEAALLSQAMSVGERLKQFSLVTELCGQRGAAWYNVGLWKLARPDLERALEELPADRIDLRAEYSLQLAGSCFWDLDIPAMNRHATAGKILAEQIERDDLIGGNLGWLATVEQSKGNLEQATQLFHGALARSKGFRAPSLGNFPLTLYLQGKIEEASHYGAESIKMYRTANDSLAATFGIPHFGLALAAAGRYDEAARVFDEVRQIGTRYEIWPFLARSIAMSAGFHLDVFDYSGNEKLACEARDRARSAGFMPSVVSANLDLLFNYARQQQVQKAEDLLQDILTTIEAIGGWHRWLWELRLSQAQAELSLARGAWSEALEWAQKSISVSRLRKRLKYEIAGQQTMGRALHALGRTREAVEVLREALSAARSMKAPASILGACSTLLSMEGTSELHAEALTTAQKIWAALPTDQMKRTFLADETVVRCRFVEPAHLPHPTVYAPFTPPTGQNRTEALNINK